MSYLFEMHYHTPVTSYCSKAPASQAFPYYLDNGYSGVVITDHYYRAWFDNLNGMSWRKKIDKWLVGYQSAKKAAKGHNLSIILGMELRFDDSYNDYLVYGISERLLYDHPELYEMRTHDFRDFADEYSLFFAQAHPFRTMCEPLVPDLLHGVEIYNGNPRHNNHNDLARNFGYENNLTTISGSDFHEIEDACRGGTYLREKPNNSQELTTLLFNGYIDGLKITAP